MQRNARAHWDMEHHVWVMSFRYTRRATALGLVGRVVVVPVGHVGGVWCLGMGAALGHFGYLLVGVTLMVVTRQLARWLRARFPQVLGDIAILTDAEAKKVAIEARADGSYLVTAGDERFRDVACVEGCQYSKNSNSCDDR